MKRSIYLIENENDGLIKIGIGKNPKLRIKQLSTGSTSKLSLLFHIESDFASKIENILHRIYSDRRKNGEWFDLQGIDLLHIEKQIFIAEQNLKYLELQGNPFI